MTERRSTDRESGQSVLIACKCSILPRIAISQSIDSVSENPLCSRPSTALSTVSCRESCCAGTGATAPRWSATKRMPTHARAHAAHTRARAHARTLRCIPHRRAARSRWAAPSDSSRESWSGSVGARDRTRRGGQGRGRGRKQGERRGDEPHTARLRIYGASSLCRAPRAAALAPLSLQLTGDDAAAADHSPQGAQEAGACADGTWPYRQAPEAPGWTR